MKKYLFVLSALVLFAFSGCKKFAGNPVSQDFAIGSAYAALEVQDAFDVTVDTTATQVTITVGEKVMPNVVVEVVDNTLKIRLKSVGAFYGGEQKAVIPYNADLTKVTLSGASDFHSTKIIECDKAEVKLSGASDFYCDIAAEEIDIDLSGSSSFNGYTVTLDADIEMTGSSDYKGDIVSGDIKMDLNGSSDFEGCVVADNLEVILSGASDAKLSGNVEALKIDLGGSSKIVKQIKDNHYALGCDSCEGKMSGSSDAYIHCDGTIKVNLSGSSDLHFTGDGNPADSSTSGGSDVYHDVLP